MVCNAQHGNKWYYKPNLSTSDEEQRFENLLLQTRVPFFRFTRRRYVAAKWKPSFVSPIMQYVLVTRGPFVETPKTFRAIISYVSQKRIRFQE